MTRPLACALLCAAAGCSQPSSVKSTRPVHKLEYSVEVAPIVSRKVRYQVTAPGSIEAFQQVQITARVAGAVDRVHFTEGQTVSAGQVLVTIEGDRFRVAVDQAKAQLAKAQANEGQAAAQLARRQGAVSQHPGLIPGEELAGFSTGVATAKADVESATEALKVAELNLRDSSVRAPIAGVIQTRTVQEGQYVQPGTVMATLLQRDPLLVRFQVTAEDAPRLKAGMAATLTLRESTRSYPATIQLVAAAADPQTRLVPVTANVSDTQHRYWLRPGAFCQVSVPIGDARDAIVVPSLAVQPTENGNLAYVVDGTTAHARNLMLGMHTPEGGVEIKSGLKVGELLVVRGFEPLSDGAPVKITERTTLAALAALPDAGTAP